MGWHELSHLGHDRECQWRDPKVIQELLRNPTLKFLMDPYVQALSDEKRTAQNKISEMLPPGMRRGVRSLMWGRFEQHGEMVSAFK